MAAKTKRQLEIEAIAKDKTATAFARITARAQLFGLKMKKVAQRIGKAFFSVRTALVGLAAGFGFQKIINDLDDLGKTARRLNLPVDDFNQLRFAAELAGVANERFSAGMRFFTTRVFEAANGSRQAAEAFRAFGVNLRDQNGRIRGSGEILGDLADGYAALPGSVEKTALSVRLFGEENSKLATLLEGGSEGLRKAREEAEFFSGKIGDGASKAEAFNDAMLRLRTGVGSVFREAVVRLAERMTGSITEFATYVASNRDRIVRFFVDVGKIMLASFQAAAAALNTFLTGFKRFSLFVNQGVNPFGNLTEQVANAEARLKSIGGETKRVRDAIARLKLSSSSGVLSEEALRDSETRLRALRAELRELGKTYRDTFAELQSLRDQASFEQSADGLQTKLNNVLQQFQAVSAEVSNLTQVSGSPIGGGKKPEGIFNGFKDGAKEFREQLEQTFAVGQEVAHQFFGSLRSGAGQELSALIQGTKSLSEAWKNFGARFAQIAADIIADLIVMTILKKALGAIFPGQSLATQALSGAGGAQGSPESLTPSGVGIATSSATDNRRSGATGLGFGLRNLRESLGSGREQGGGGMQLQVQVSQNITHPDGEALGRALNKQADGISDIIARKILERPDVRRAIRGAR